jgi:translation elongation factor EF-Ts
MPPRAWCSPKTSADGTQGCAGLRELRDRLRGQERRLRPQWPRRWLGDRLGKRPRTAEALKAAAYDSNGITIAEKLIEQTGVIGEKIDVNTCQRRGEAPFVYAYNHPGNKVASFVGLNKPGFETAAKDVAMQAAAMGPIALDKSSTPQSVIDKELEIGKELAIQEGKAR